MMSKIEGKIVCMDPSFIEGDFGDIRVLRSFGYKGEEIFELYEEVESKSYVYR
ncbi:MAG: hypothetical protein QXR13_01850 [Candidatus Bathyarchaeia archaeon]